MTQTRNTFDPADNMPTLEGKLDANAAKDQSVQVALGLQDGDEEIGTQVNYADPAAATADTVKVRLDKLEQRGYGAALHSGDADGASRDLGSDFDINAATDGLIGTTYINAAGPVVSDYPRGDQLYEVEITRSAAVTGTSNTEGEYITRRLVARNSGQSREWISTRTGGTNTGWRETTNDQLTQSDTARTTRELADNADIHTLVSGGWYAGAWGFNAAQAAALPSLPASGQRTWHLDVRRISDTQGFITASSEYAVTGEASTVHVFWAQVTKADVDAEWSTGFTWAAMHAQDAAEGDIKDKALRSHNWVLATPDPAFDALPGRPRKSSTGWSCTVSAFSQKPADSGTTYYVDALLGDDSNAGDAAAPFKTIKRVFDETDFTEIQVAPGEYGYLDAWGFVNNIDAAVTAYSVVKWPNGRQGEVIITSERRTTSWTQVSGEKSWEATVHTPAHVVDLGHRNEDGSFLNVTPVATAADVNDTPNSYHITGSGSSALVRVRTRDGLEPTEQILGLSNFPAWRDIGDRRDVYLEGLVLIGGDEGAESDNNSGIAGGSLVMSNCHVTNCGGPGVRIDGTATFFLEDVLVTNCLKDGIQYFSDGSNHPLGIEVRAKTRNNHTGSLTDSGNGTSAHNSAKVLRIGSDHGGAVGAQYVDINDAMIWNVGCRAKQSGATTNLSSEGGFVAGDQVQAWLFECEDTVNNVGVRQGGTSTVLTDCCTFNTTSGTIGSYEQL